MNTRSKILFFTFILFLFGTGIVLASITEGGIDPNNVGNTTASFRSLEFGRVNFKTTNSTVTVTDTGFTGFAWGENVGWINLNPTNGNIDIDAAGVVTGFWFGENTGWINLNPTNGGLSIDSQGFFQGDVWAENHGWLQFSCPTGPGSPTCVETDYRVQNVRPQCNNGLNDDPGEDNKIDFPADLGCDSLEDDTESVVGGGFIIVPSGGGIPTPPPTPPTPPTPPEPPVEPSEPSPEPEDTLDDALPPPPPPQPEPEPEPEPEDEDDVTPPGPPQILGVFDDIVDFIDDLFGGPDDEVVDDEDIDDVPPPGPPALDDAEEDIDDEDFLPPPTDLDVLIPGVGIDPGTGTDDGFPGPGSPAITTTLDTISNVVTATVDRVRDLIFSPTGNVIVTTTALAGLIIGGAITIASTLFSSPLAVSELAQVPGRISSLFLGVFGFRKRRHPWGTLYDSVTKQPLDPGVVVLKDEAGNEIDTSITDLDGRYFFLTNPGTYTLEANKTHYTFPSQRLSGRTNDELYRDLYFGEKITITDSGEIITKNIPLDPIDFDWNEFEKDQKKLMKFYSNRDKVLARISGILFALGFFVTTVALIISPVLLNYILFGLYIVLLVLRRKGLSNRKFGSIKDKETGNPLSFAIVRIFSQALSTEIAHSVADRTGKYYTLVPNGVYYAKVEKKNPDGSYSVIHTSPPIVAKKGYINTKFDI
ncbi:hypothetical protein COB64_01275 [Candidatus Wolfebacteria bacterium]|nr:MAG: hypothetical protein COB64_01275 [Candidatus Wolfebacteria bacterium]